MHGRDGKSFISNTINSEILLEIARIAIPSTTPIEVGASTEAPLNQPQVTAIRNRQLSGEKVISEYLEPKKYKLIDSYAKPTIINDADVGRLAAIAEAFKLHRELEFYPLPLGKSKLPEHFSIKTSQRELVIGFINASGTTFTSRIKNFNQLVVNYSTTQFFKPEILVSLGLLARLV